MTTVMKVVVEPKAKTFFIEECEHLSVVEIVVPDLIPTPIREVYARMKGQKYILDKRQGIYIGGSLLINLTTPGAVSIPFDDVYSSSFRFHKFTSEIHLTPVL